MVKNRPKRARVRYFGVGVELEQLRDVMAGIDEVLGIKYAATGWKEQGDPVRPDLAKILPHWQHSISLENNILILIYCLAQF